MGFNFQCPLFQDLFDQEVRRLYLDTEFRPHTTRIFRVDICGQVLSLDQFHPHDLQIVPWRCDFFRDVSSGEGIQFHVVMYADVCCLFRHFAAG